MAPWPRLLELRDLRGPASDGAALHARAAAFSDQDFRDLQVLSKLAWFDLDWLAHDPDVRALCAKGRGYDEADKALLRARELALLRAIVPAYRAAAERAQIELSTSPYYHPILPLLADTDAHHEAHPGAHAAAALPPPRGRARPAVAARSCATRRSSAARRTASGPPRARSRTRWPGWRRQPGCAGWRPTRASSSAASGCAWSGTTRGSCAARTCCTCPGCGGPRTATSASSSATARCPTSSASRTRAGIRTRPRRTCWSASARSAASGPRPACRARLSCRSSSTARTRGSTSRTAAASSSPPSTAASRTTPPWRR